MPNGEWNRRLTGEPTLHELLADPCLHAVMRRDGVDMPTLLNVITAAKSRLRRDLCRLAAAA
jgi:hypothetical protein